MAFKQAVTIVVADDFAPFRRLVRSKLQQSEFYTVIEASDGIEAVAMATKFRPDLVLLDIEMPNLDGLKAAAQIRSISPESRILFVSTHCDPGLVQSALSDGAVGYLCKADINHELLPAIEAALACAKFVSARLRPYVGRESTG